MSAPRLHLLKLSVGSESTASLATFILARAREHGVCFHGTRMAPKRREELLDGGSIYWIIQGSIQARQRLLDITPVRREDGVRAVRLILEPRLVSVETTPHRPFQGWRYFAPADAPPDLAPGAQSLPPALARDLRRLGLL